MSTPNSIKPASAEEYADHVRQLAKACDQLNAGHFTINGVWDWITQLVQAHFAWPDNYQTSYPALSCLTYNPAAPAKSSLYVGPEHQINPALGEAQAGIYVGLRDVRSEKQVLGDLDKMEPASEDRDLYPDEAQYVDRGEAELARITMLTVVLHCYHSSLGLAWDLAESASDFLLASKESAHRLGFRHFDLENLQPRLRRNDAQKQHVVTLRVTVSFKQRVLLQYQSHNLRQVMLSITREVPKTPA